MQEIHNVLKLQTLSEKQLKKYSKKYTNIIQNTYCIISTDYSGSAFTIHFEITSYMHFTIADKYKQS